MNTFEITIGHMYKERWPVIVDQSQPGSLLIRKESSLNLDEDRLEELRSLELEHKHKDYGEFLGKALFYDEVRDAFMQARAKSKGNVRVFLVVESDRLKTLHWERVCAPIRTGGLWDFLALDQQILFSLYLPSPSDRHFPPIGRRDLRALVVAANPRKDNKYNLDSFNVQDTVKGVQTSLGEIPHDILANANVSNAIGLPTFKEIRRRLTDQHYTLLHIVAHGWFNKSTGETLLYLLNGKEEVSPVTSTDFIMQLDGIQRLPQLTFLSTCDSAAPEAERAGALGGFAQRLVRLLGMPSVIAMTEKVSIDTATTLARNFYEHLLKDGQVDRALVQACAGLLDAYDITVPALYNRLGGRPLFSDTEDRDLTDSEIEFGLTRLEKLLQERAPIVLHAFRDKAIRVRGYLGSEQSSLSETALEEWNQTYDEIKTLCAQVLEMNFSALALNKSIPGYTHQCPFPGLKAFQTENKDFFFGRETIVSKLIKHINGQNFLALLGASGSGKSSLVLAGLVPALREYFSYYMTPGNDPVSQLEKILEERHKGTEAQRHKVLSQEKSQQEENERNNSLLIVDQFEELFTLCTDLVKRQTFLDRLLVLSQKSDTVKIIIIMRADFWGDCAPYSELKALMEANQELLAPMSTSELRSAMEQQAARVGLRFEADLSHTILAEVQDEPGAMPLLQHLLQELWKHRYGRWLKTSEYRALGGIKQAIAHTADALYNSFSESEKEHMQNIFIRLTRLGEETDSEHEYRDTRRRVILSEFVPVGKDHNVIRNIINRLADDRLIITAVNDDTKETDVEVTHEALIRFWPRLRRWLDEDRRSLRLLASINHDAKEWNTGGRAENLLPRWNERLEEAVVLFRQTRFKQNELERDYLEACEKLRDKEEAKEKERVQALEKAKEAAEKLAEEQTQRVQEKEQAARRLRRRALFLAGSLFLALILAAAAGWQWQKSLTNEITALTHSSEAQYKSNKQLLNALIPALEAGIKLKQTGWASDEIRTQAATALYHAVHSAREYNRLEGKHESDVNSVSFSPDGKLIATGGLDTLVNLWTSSGEHLLTLDKDKGHTNEVTSISFSPDSQTIATASFDETIKIWKSDGTYLQTLKGHKGNVVSVSFSHDGQTIASAGKDNTVKLWRKDNGKWGYFKTLSGHENEVYSVSFSPDSQTIASASWDATVKLWTSEGNLKCTLEHYNNIDKDRSVHVYSVSFSQDNQTVASTGSDGRIRLWNSLTGEEISSFQAHDTVIMHVVFSPDDKLIATTGWDGRVKLWSRDGKKIQTLVGHSGASKSISFSPDSKLIAATGEDGSVKLWSLGRAHILEHGRSVKSLDFSPDNHVLAAASWDNANRGNLNAKLIKLWSLEDGRELYSINGHVSGVRRVSFNPKDKNVMATVGNDGKVILWDVGDQNMKERKTLDEHGRVNVEALRFSPDGKFIATADLQGKLRVWTRNGELLNYQNLNHPIWDVCFSSDGQTIAIASQNSPVQLWKWNNDELKLKTFSRESEHKGLVFSVTFSPDKDPDKQIIATAGDDLTVKLWSLEGNLLHILHDRDKHITHDRAVTSVNFSPNGQLIATASDDQTVKLWSREGKLLRTLRGHSDEVKSVSFSPDGQFIASGSSDGKVFLWDINLSLAHLDELFKLGCKQARNYLKHNLKSDICD